MDILQGNTMVVSDSSDIAYHDTLEDLVLPRLRSGEWFHTWNANDDVSALPNDCLLAACGDLMCEPHTRLEAAARYLVFNSGSVHPKVEALLGGRTTDEFGYYDERWVGNDLLSFPFCPSCSYTNPLDFSLHPTRHSEKVGCCVDVNMYELIETLNVDYGIKTTFSCQGYVLYVRETNWFPMYSYLSAKGGDTIKLRELLVNAYNETGNYVLTKAVSDAFGNPEKPFFAEGYEVPLMVNFSEKTYGVALEMDIEAMNVTVEAVRNVSQRT